MILSWREIQPCTAVGHQEDVLHKAENSWKDNRASIGKAFGCAPKVDQHCYLEARSGEDQGGDLPIFKQGPQITAGYHVEIHSPYAVLSRRSHRRASGYRWVRLSPGLTMR